MSVVTFPVPGFSAATLPPESKNKIRKDIARRVAIHTAIYLGVTGVSTSLGAVVGYLMGDPNSTATNTIWIGAVTGFSLATFIVILGNCCIKKSYC